MNKYLDLSPEVAKALAEGKPVVALESTIISHGMPYPQNVETALKVEQTIRENGAVPATIAIIGGRLKAGLTPEEFYQYATTGIYPLDSYFGVPASEMMAVGDIKKVRRAYADEEARKRRETAAAKREERRQIDPVRTISRDQALLDRMISKWKQVGDAAQKQVEHLKGILEQTKEAMKYVANLTLEALEELKDPLSWRNHEELKYVFAMNELF